MVIQAGDRRKPWSEFAGAALAEAEARKLKMIGFDARVVPGRVIAGELVLPRTEGGA